MYQAYSWNGGRTWSEPHEILNDGQPVKGYPPHLLKLNDGRVLLTYGYRLEPYGERAVLSSDGGITWDFSNEILINPSFNGDLGYPSSIEIDGGGILTVYYQVDKEGEMPSLMGTIWKV